MHPAKGPKPVIYQGPKGASGADSASSYSQNDIYSFIRTGKTQPLNNVKDTKSTSKEEAPRRVLDQNNGAFFILVKSGKFFALLFIVPAKFFLHRVPKWVIVTILPKVFLITKNIASTCKENINKLIQNIAKKAAVINGLTEALKSFTATLKSSFNQMMQNFLSPFKKGADEIASLLKKASDFLNDKMKAFSSFTSKIFNFFENAFEFAKRSEKLGFKSKISLPKVKMDLSPIIKKAENISQKAKSILDRLKRNAADNLKPLKEYVKAQSKKLAEALNVVKQKIEEFIQPKIELMTAYVQKAVQVFNPPIALAFSLFNQMNNRAGVAFAKVKSIQLFKSKTAVLQKMTVKMQKSGTAVLRSFERLFKEGYSLSKKASKKLEKQLVKVKNKLIGYGAYALTAIKFLNGILMRIYGYLLRGFKKFLKVGLGVIRWCRIMGRFTGYILREIFREIKLQIEKELKA